MESQEIMNEALLQQHRCHSSDLRLKNSNALRLRPRVGCASGQKQGRLLPDRGMPCWDCDV